MSHYREVLQSLRCDVGFLRDDHCYDSLAHAIASRMLATIDQELARVPAVIADSALVACSTRLAGGSGKCGMPTADDQELAAMSNAALLKELGRRIPKVQHLKICTKCGVGRHRARGLCHKCYKIALKRGEIKARRGFSDGSSLKARR